MDRVRRTRPAPTPSTGVFDLDALRDGQLLQHYLMASYLYYICDSSPISDAEYDALSKRLVKVWRKIKHPHKRLVEFEALSAGSAFYIREHEYPFIVRSAAGQWYRTLRPAMVAPARRRRVR